MGGQPGPITETIEQDHLPESRQVTLRAEKLSSLLGIDIPAQEVEEILTRLGLTLEAREDDAWRFAVPSYRFDIAIEPDLVEEVGRIYGYNNLPRVHASADMILKPQAEAVWDINRISDTLVSLGYQEAITYSFVDRVCKSRSSPR